MHATAYVTKQAFDPTPHDSSKRQANTAAATTKSSVPTILTPAVHKKLAQMKARHAAVEQELNALHSSSSSSSSSSTNPQKLAQLSKELAELGEAVDLAGQLEGKRGEVCIGVSLVVLFVW